MKPYCGDGETQDAEECDDGNSSDNDRCTNSCKNAKCGDGFIQPGENCDDGENNGKYGYCDSDCQHKIECGDGIIQRYSCSGIPSTVTCVASLANSSNNEECDPGRSYTRGELCQLAGHGNNTYYNKDDAASTTLGIYCDSNGKIQGATKGGNCQWCGDGVINGSEGCDGTSYTNSATSCIRSTSCGNECWVGCDKKSYCSYSACSNKTCNSCVETWTCTGASTDCGSSTSDSCGAADNGKVVYN